jgi:DNA-binding protein HU-beta
LESTKVGQASRDGIVTGVDGGLLRIEWSTGEESSLIPGAGSITIVGKARKASGQKAAKRTTKKTTTAKRAPARKAAKRTTKKKATAKRAPARKAAKRTSKKKATAKRAPARKAAKRTTKKKATAS